MTKPNITMLEGTGSFGTSRERSRWPPVSSETDSSSGRLEIVGRGLCKRPVRYRYMPKWTRQTTPSPPLPILSSDMPNSATSKNSRPNPLEAVSFFSDTSDTYSTRSTTPTVKPDSAYYSEYHPEDGAHPAMPRPPMLCQPVGDVAGSMESQLVKTGTGRWEGELVTCTAGDRQSNSQSSSYGPASDVTDPNHSTSSIPSDDGGSSLTDSVEHLYGLSPPSFEDFLGFPGDFSESSSCDLDTVGNSGFISDRGYHEEGELDHYVNNIGSSINDGSTGILQSQVELDRPRIQRENEGIVLCRPRIHRGNCSKGGLTDSTGTYIISDINPTGNRHIQQNSGKRKGTEFGLTFHITPPVSVTPTTIIKQTGQVRSDTIILEKSAIEWNKRIVEDMPANHFDSNMDKPSDIADDNSTTTSRSAGAEEPEKQLVSMTTGNQVKLPQLKVTSPQDRSRRDDLPKSAANLLNVSGLGSEGVEGNAGQVKRIQDLDALADNMAMQAIMMKMQQERKKQQATAEVEQSVGACQDVTSQVKDARQVAITTNFTRGDQLGEPATIAEIGKNHRDKQLNTTFVLLPNTSLQQGRQSVFKDSQARQNTAKRLSVEMEKNAKLDPGDDFVITDMRPSSSTPTVDFFYQEIQTSARSAEVEKKDNLDPGDNFIMPDIRPSSSTIDFFDQGIPTSARSANANGNDQMPPANFNNNSREQSGDVSDHGGEEIPSGGNSDTEEGGQVLEGDMFIRHVLAFMSHQADGPLIGQDVRNTLTVIPAQPEVGDSLNHVVLGLTDEILATLRGYTDLPMTDYAADMAPTPPPPRQGQADPQLAEHHELDEMRASSPHINTANNNSANCQQQESAHTDNVNEDDEMDSLSEELEALSSDLVSQVIRRAAENEELARSAAVLSSASGVIGVSAGPSYSSPSPVIAKVSDDKSEVGNQYDYEDDFEDGDEVGGGANSSRTRVSIANHGGAALDRVVSQIEEGEAAPIASVCEEESECNKDNTAGMSPVSPRGKEEESLSTSIEPEQQLEMKTTKVSKVKPIQALPGKHKKGSDQGKAGQHLTPGMKQQTHRPISRTWRPTTKPVPPGESGTSPREQRTPGGGRYTTQTRKNSRMSNSLKSSAVAYGVRERKTKPVGSLSTIRKDTHSNHKGDRHSPHPPKTPKLPPVEDPVRTSSESLRRPSPTKTSNDSSRPTLPTFGRPQTIRALGTSARKLRDFEQPAVTPESEATEQEQEREGGGRGRPRQGQTTSGSSSHRRPWRQGHGHGAVTEGANHKVSAAMSKRQVQIDFSNKLAARTAAHRQKTLPGLPSVLKSDAYWQNGQLHIRVHGPARLLCPDTSAVEGEAQLAGCTEESPTVPLDVRITLVRDHQGRSNRSSSGNLSSTSGYRGPLADARLGVQSSPTTVKPARTILDTRAVHAQFRTNLARVSAMPRGRLRPLDRVSNGISRQESTSSDAQSSK